MSKFKLLLVVVVTLLVISKTLLIDCTPFKVAPQGISEDNREFTKIKDKRMYAEAKDYKGFIYKNGDEAFCFRFKSPEIEKNKVYPYKPMWFFHSRNDNAVDFECSTKVVEKLQSLGATNILTTWFDEPLHDITPLVYSKNEVWKWLFNQKL